MEIIDEMSNEDYHNADGWSSSQVKKVLDSVATMLTKTKQTEAMMVGTAFHTRLLEKEKYLEEYIVSPKFDKRTKAGKAGFGEFSEHAKGKIILTEDQDFKLERMEDSFYSHKLAPEFVTGGIAEQSVFCEDPDTGLLCKVRPDYRTDDFISDLKSTSCASSECFGRQVNDFKYHLSAAMYLDIVNLAFYTGLKDFYLIAVENKEPFITEVYRLPPEVIALGREMYKKGLEKIKKYLSEENPDISYSGGKISDVQLPAWAFNN